MHSTIYGSLTRVSFYRRFGVTMSVFIGPLAFENPSCFGTREHRSDDWRMAVCPRWLSGVTPGDRTAFPPTADMPSLHRRARREM